jgi:hypothetical protein
MTKLVAAVVISRGSLPSMGDLWRLIFSIAPRAVQTSISVVRAFLRLRTMALAVEELSRKVAALERKYDEQFRIVFDAVRQLLEPPNESPNDGSAFIHDCTTSFLFA